MDRGLDAASLGNTETVASVRCKPLYFAGFTLRKAIQTSIVTPIIEGKAVLETGQHTAARLVRHTLGPSLRAGFSQALKVVLLVTWRRTAGTRGIGALHQRFKPVRTKRGCMTHRGRTHPKFSECKRVGRMVTQDADTITTLALPVILTLLTTDSKRVSADRARHTRRVQSIVVRASTDVLTSRSVDAYLIDGTNIGLATPVDPSAE